MTAPQDAPLLAFYGDDFTGSTDAMEATALANLPTVLFTRTPSPELLARFRSYAVIGIAGTARSRDPAWMEAKLRPALEALASRRPRVLQYKICSTFDSAPETGSIGRAIDIGRSLLPPDWSPIVVGVPQLGRWQAFSNLFAAAGSTVHRIDRHPTMSRHPVTPMREADLRVHLSRQTAYPIGSIDLGQLSLDGGASGVSGARAGREITFIDVADERTQTLAGRLVWDSSEEHTVFSAASSGLQYALVAHWREIGLVPAELAIATDVPPVDRLLVVSGSCSPITAEQIAIAEDADFVALRLDVQSVCDPGMLEMELHRLQGEIARGFESHRGVLVYAARTVDDPAFEDLRNHAAALGLSFVAAQAAIGSALGSLASWAIGHFGLKRLVVAGGDTSGRVIEGLPVDALELKYPLSRGAPICRCHSDDPGFDGFEIVLKGGQLGRPTLFADALYGVG